MTCEPCTYSQASAVDSLPTSSLDTRQLSLLSGMPMPAKSLENEPQMDGFPTCQCGKGMSVCLIHPNTRESWIASMQDSLAKTLASLGNRQAYMREPDQVFTAKSCASLAWYDQSSCSWRTYQQSFLSDSEPYSETWPRWGMTAGGSAYAHPMSERRITEIDGSVWLGTPTAAMSVRSPEFAGSSHPTPAEFVKMFPTPTTIDAGTGRFNTSVGSSNARPTLAMMAKKDLWPTPTAHNAKETNAPSEANRNTPTLAAQVGGQLNPDWVGWLMGFPIGWANSKATATRKSRFKPQLPIGSLVESEVTSFAKN